MRWNFIHEKFVDRCRKRLGVKDIICGSTRIEVESSKMDRLVERGCIQKTTIRAGNPVFVMSPCALRVNDELDILVEAGFEVTDCRNSDVDALVKERYGEHAVRDVYCQYLNKKKVFLHLLGDTKAADKFYAVLDRVGEGYRNSFSYWKSGIPKEALHYLRARALVELEGKYSEAKDILLRNNPCCIERSATLDSYRESEIEEMLFYNAYSWSVLFGDEENAKLCLDAAMDQEDRAKYALPKGLYAQMYILLLNDHDSAKNLLDIQVTNRSRGNFDLAQDWYELFGDMDRCRRMAIDLEISGKMVLGKKLKGCSQESSGGSFSWELVDAERIWFQILSDRRRADLLLLSSLWIAIQRRDMKAFRIFCHESSLSCRLSDRARIEKEVTKAAEAMGASLFELDLDLLRVFFEDFGIEFQVANGKVESFCRSIGT